MLASCITKKPREHCGQSKKDKYSDDFISPYEENCEQFFEYGNSSGKVYATGDNMRANYTIELLKLNEKSLCAARREAYWTSGIQSMTKEELNELVRDIRDGSGEIPFRGMLLSLAEERLQND